MIRIDIIIEDQRSCNFKRVSTLFFVTGPKFAKNCEMNDARIPIAVTTRGKKIASPSSSKSILEADTTRAAHVASASDPNRSAPIPAISPTLSPTLSAIVPGF